MSFDFLRYRINLFSVIRCVMFTLFLFTLRKLQVLKIVWVFGPPYAVVLNLRVSECTILLPEYYFMYDLL